MTVDEHKIKEAVFNRKNAGIPSLICEEAGIDVETFNKVKENDPQIETVQEMQQYSIFGAANKVLTDREDLLGQEAAEVFSEFYDHRDNRGKLLPEEVLEKFRGFVIKTLGNEPPLDMGQLNPYAW